MKVCIYGAGAIGGYIGAQLAASGCEVSAVARGATLEALRKHGLRLQLKDALVTAQIRAAEDPRELGPQDLVVVAVKTTALTDVASHIRPLLGNGHDRASRHEWRALVVLQRVRRRLRRIAHRVGRPWRRDRGSDSCAPRIRLRRARELLGVRDPGWYAMVRQRLIVGEPDGNAVRSAYVTSLRG